MGLLILSLTAGYRLVSAVSAARSEAAARHAARLESGDKNGDKAANIGATAANGQVKIGIYMDRIPEVSIKETSWTADFFLWFVWKGKDYNPGETFRVVDGEVGKKEKIKEETLPDGSTYALYQVEAKVTKFFDVSRFPADDHQLTLRIEDAKNDESKLRFVADSANSGLSSRVRVQGYSTGAFSTIVQPHAYKTTHGDPRLPPGYQVKYSQFIYAIPIAREGAGFYIKLFQGLFAAVAIAVLAFFIKPTDVDPRFGLGVGAFFAAIANCYITASLLPDTGQASLADTVNSVAIFAIFLTLVQSTISLWIYDIRDNPQLSIRFDRMSAFILPPAYAVINWLIYQAAAG